MSIFNKKSNIFLLIFLAELISLLGFVYPDIRQISFWVLCFLFLIISLKDLRFGVLILLVELFIGSKGYLFYFESDGIIISVRIAFWLIILSVWTAKSFNNLIKTKSCPIKPVFKMKNFNYLFVLFVFIAWGVANGILRGNDLSNVFFDFNNWLYFALILPFASVVKTKDDLKLIWNVFLVSVIWLSFKTYILLFFFSHNIPGTIEMLYSWVRTTGVGEITLIQGGFYRIFFQSHIYNLIAFFIFLISTSSVIARRNEMMTSQSRVQPSKHGIITPSAHDDRNFFTIYYFLFIISFSVILLSFSRSFWVGLIVGFICFVIYVIWQYNWRLLMKMFGLIILSGVLSLVLITAVVKFPYPNPLGGFSTTDLISNRAKQVSGEAAVSSRWNLLPELWIEIKQAPILGKGLGATVTYKSNDPRIVESTADSQFTTYAFEWGWMDVWLKFGIFGCLVYITLLFKLLVFGIKYFKSRLIIISLLISLISLSAVHFFTPYLNHPLGIGFVMLLILALNIYYSEEEQKPLQDF